MTLRIKTLLVVGITIVCLVSILYAISRVTVLDSFTQLEIEDVDRNVERAVSALQDDIDRLESISGDWAPWDDTYAFIQDANEEYIQNNLVDVTFANLGINLMIYVNTSGEIVHGQAFDLLAYEQLPPPQGLQEYVSGNSPLVSHLDEESTITGIIMLQDGPMLVASHPILTNEHTGPIRGALIVGRYLDTAEIASLAEQTHLSLDFRQIGGPQLPPDYEAALAELTAVSTAFVRPLDGETVAGYALLEDINGKPLLLLRADMPRDIYEHGVASNRYTILSLVGIGLALIVLTMLLLERLVLSRLTRLSKSVEAIGAGGKMSARVAVEGNDELSSLGNNINTMLSALQSAAVEQKRMEQQLMLAGRLAAVGELAAGVAHELNNPLAAVQAYAQLLDERKDLDDSTRKDVNTIYKQALRASKITGNLLSFAREHKPERSLSSINELIKSSLDLNAYKLKVNSIDVITHLAPDLPQTMVDPHQIQQVFVNLITNAEQAMSEAHGRGTLHIETSSYNGTIRIVFKDDGPGIPEERLNKMFDPFFTTKDVGKGTGLGLSICYGIVQAHGGRIVAQSEVGKGATFTVELSVSTKDQCTQTRSASS